MAISGSFPVIVCGQAVKFEYTPRPACISHQAAMNLVNALSILGYEVLADKQTVLERPIPVLAGSGTVELGLHSIHSCAMHLIAARRSAVPVLRHASGSW